VFPLYAWSQLEGENLIQDAPPGYRVDFQTKKDNMVMTEMVPNGESVNDWTEMLTTQVFLGMKDASLEKFQSLMRLSWLIACKDGQVTPVTNGEVNGYPYVTWKQSCPLNSRTGKPEITWFKAIKGNDSFYFVQKAFKFEPSKEQLAPWMQHLESVSVCDTRLPDRGCPKLEEIKTPMDATRALLGKNYTTLKGFREGVSTAEQVESALGKADYVDHNPDGRFVYLYDVTTAISNDPRAKEDFGNPESIKAIFLFGSDAKLIKLNYFKK